MENWILVIVFFFNGAATVKQIEGYESAAACQKAASAFKWPDGEAKCIPGPKK